LKFREFDLDISYLNLRR